MSWYWQRTPLCYGVPHVWVAMKEVVTRSTNRKQGLRSPDVKAHVSEIMRKDISEKDNVTMKAESATLEYSQLSTNLQR